MHENDIPPNEDTSMAQPKRAKRVHTGWLGFTVLILAVILLAVLGIEIPLPAALLIAGPLLGASAMSAYQLLAPEVRKGLQDGVFAPWAAAFALQALSEFIDGGEIIAESDLYLSFFASLLGLSAWVGLAKAVFECIDNRPGPDPRRAIDDIQRALPEQHDITADQPRRQTQLSVPARDPRAA